MAKGTEMTCGIHGSCFKCMGAKALVLGILVLLNAYLAVVDWAVFVGIILVLGGIMRMAMPVCPHCK
ncbi:hypothetical protein HY638_02645 [Candidatus Woesearchaeota archaeon]|nr:hypothetical protein [Candidatus Woesearchaeota archaeon]